MKRIIIAIVFILCNVLCVKNSYSQVVQKQADKWQLKNGVKLKPTTKVKGLTKTKSISVNAIKSQDIDVTVKKKDKVVKPPKVLKYSKQRVSNNIRKEDEK